MEWSEAYSHARVLICDGEHGGLFDRMRREMPQYLWVDRHPVDENDIYDVGKHEPVGWCTCCEKWVPLAEAEAISKSQATDPHVDEDEYNQWSPSAGWTAWEINHYFHEGKIRHKEFAMCPNCMATVQCRDLWRGRKSMRADRRFFVTWRKSCKDPGVLVMTGFDVWSDWSSMSNAEPEQVTKAEAVEVCVFRYGKGGERWMREWHWQGESGYKRGWTKKSRCVSGSSQYGELRIVCEAGALEEAAEGTPIADVLERMGADRNWHPNEGYRHDKVTMLDRICRLPCVEYLYKIGQGEIGAKVIDGSTHGLVDLRGKTAARALRMTADEWGEVKGKKLRLSIEALLCREVLRRAGVRINMETICKLARWNVAAYSLENLLKHNHKNPAKAIKYCCKKGVRIGDYNDMLDQMRQLQMDLSDDKALYPADFYEMHRRYSDRINLLRLEESSQKKAKLNPLIDKQISSGKLDEYFFSALGLVMRPMVSAKEIIREGTIQHICVGSYVETYAKGRDVLCVIRREDALETPLYTVEFTPDGKLVQCRGERNRAPAKRDNMDLFWALFEDARAKLRQQRKKGRSKTA